LHRLAGVGTLVPASNRQKEGIRKVIFTRLAHLTYGPCDHPAIQQHGDGKWYCTECSAQVG